MSDSPAYLWIRTRDGSPTLWHEALSESFRSVKGAFTESWAAFVAPALENLAAGPVTVGEFGLGPGTNWVLWTLAATKLGHRFDYFAIERDPSSFALGRRRWMESAEMLAEFVSAHGPTLSASEVRAILTDAPDPRLISSVECAPKDLRASVWFHDPFGYAVNPEGYSDEILARCRELWAPGLEGFSYACNGRFQKRLDALAGVMSEVVPTGGQGLKRERLRFRVARDDKPGGV